MAHSPQARKRIRQNERQRLYNRSIKSEIKTLTKSFVNCVESKESTQAQDLFRELVSKMDKAARKRVYHPNTVARRKSRAARLLKSVLAS